MKLTKKKLKEIIKEEILNEDARAWLGKIKQMENIFDNLEMNDGMGMSSSQWNFTDKLREISGYMSRGISVSDRAEGEKELKKLSTEFKKIKKEIMDYAQKSIKQAQGDVKKLDASFSKLKNAKRGEVWDGKF